MIDYKLVILDNNYWMYIDMAIQVKYMLELKNSKAAIVPYSIDAVNTENERYVFFGTRYPSYYIPPGSIVTNFDNTTVLFLIITENIINTCEIWNYSNVGISAIYAKYPSSKCKLLELGYTPEHDYSISHIEENKDIDVLLLGDLTTRRQLIVESLKNMGFSVAVVYTKNGFERADLVRRSKVCISVYTSDLCDCIASSRFSTILASGGFIITEECTDEYQNDKWSKLTITVQYNKLVETVAHWIRQPEERIACAEKFTEKFRSVLPQVVDVTL